tara:strand:- start:1962 stop:2267 length:306 start_codon:yes stop_codon:yes gene_type:complete
MASSLSRFGPGVACEMARNTGQDYREFEMDSLPYEAQTALVSFSTALLIGAPVALFGAGRVFEVARVATRFAMRRQLVTSLGIGVIGCVGALAASVFGISA